MSARRRSRVANVVRSHGADFDMEFRVVWPDGTVHWLDHKGKTTLDAAGRPRYMTGACVDITARREAEERLRDYEGAARDQPHR